MTDQHAIQAISRLLEYPDTIDQGDTTTIARLAEKYPYFVPARYVLAAGQHQKEAFSSVMLSGIFPYTGNWILFWEYVQGIKPVKTEATWDDDDVVADEVESTIAIACEEPVEASMEKGENDKINITDDIAAEPIENEQEIIDDITETLDTEASVEMDKDVNELFAREESVFVDIEEVADADLVVADNFENEQTQETLNITEAEVTNPVGEADDEVPAYKVHAEEPIFQPTFSEDYFLQQGIKITGELPDQVEELIMHQDELPGETTKEKSLMVMMSFKEWLLHFKNAADKQTSEIEDKKAIKTMWQKERLAAALEEENDEIPENVFEMAVNSITKEEGLASESLAEIYVKQGKYDKAIEMYRKLSLHNPQKNAYFARKIEAILKDKQI